MELWDKKFKFNVFKKIKDKMGNFGFFIIFKLGSNANFEVENYWK